jgi:hypothetical protein
LLPQLVCNFVQSCSNHNCTGDSNGPKSVCVCPILCSTHLHLQKNWVAVQSCCPDPDLATTETICMLNIHSIYLVPTGLMVRHKAKLGQSLQTTFYITAQAPRPKLYINKVSGCILNAEITAKYTHALLRLKTTLPTVVVSVGQNISHCTDASRETGHVPSSQGPLYVGDCPHHGSCYKLWSMFMSISSHSNH